MEEEGTKKANEADVQVLGDAAAVPALALGLALALAALAAAAL